MNKPGQIIAMHGWSGDSRAWNNWAEFARYRGWVWQSGERGYGHLPVVIPQWNTYPIGLRGPRVLIVHSLGFHLLPRKVLALAEVVILLNSFSNFTGLNEQKDFLDRAIQRMIKNISLQKEEKTLSTFLSESNWPKLINHVNSNSFECSLSQLNKLRLNQDLLKLRETTNLPTEFPMNVNVLVIESYEDRIITSKAKRNLLENLSNHLDKDVRFTHWLIKGIGHSLFKSNLLEYIFDWLETEQ